MLVLVLPALAADLPRIEYSRPDAKEEDTAVVFTRWSPGQVLYTADATAVAETPGALGGREVPLGLALTVVRAGSLARIGGMVNTWYEVQAGEHRGWVFGALLTPFAFRGDLDGDGASEVATVSFTPDFEIRVRSGGKVLDVSTAGGAYLSQRGAGVQADLVPATAVGIPLLHLHTNVEACGDYAEYWVSFVAGAPVVARREAGLVDPPSCFTFETAFEPGRMRVTYTREECGEVKTRETETKTYKMVNGVFVD